MQADSLQVRRARVALLAIYSGGCGALEKNLIPHPFGLLADGIPNVAIPQIFPLPVDRMSGLLKSQCGVMHLKRAYGAALRLRRIAPRLLCDQIFHYLTAGSFLETLSSESGLSSILDSAHKISRSWLGPEGRSLSQ